MLHTNMTPQHQNKDSFAVGAGVAAGQTSLTDTCCLAVLSHHLQSQRSVNDDLTRSLSPRHVPWTTPVQQLK